MARQSAAPPRAAIAATVVTMVSCLLLLWLLPTTIAADVSDVAQGGAALAAAIGATWRMRHGGDRRIRATWALIATACLLWASGKTYWCWYASAWPR
ncbi:hypothetical protein A6V29_08090 [Blastococcus sp. CCUG 61487]|nr:hypothetical protein A6V29_08090 [Blastococcus sp. CCUG 61487]